MRIALVALTVTSVAVMLTASALNAIATSKSETEPRRSDLTHRSAANFHYGIAHVSMPKGKKTFPPELLPEPRDQNCPERFSRPHSNYQRA